MVTKTTLVWFRRDLRLSDNLALQAALKNSSHVLPVYIWSPKEEAPWEPGAASRWWLHNSLRQLSIDLEKKSSFLIIRSGTALEELLRVLKETKADAVYWNRLYEPSLIKRDKLIASKLEELGYQVKSFPGAMLMDPWEIKNSSGKPFRVFTPFWKKIQIEYKHQKPLSVPKKIPSTGFDLNSLKLSKLNLLPKVAWDSEFYQIWRPGETETRKRLKNFVRTQLHLYNELRDRPDHCANSLMAASLHFGEITPRQIWHEVIKEVKNDKTTYKKIAPFLRQLAWRDFSSQLLFNFPYSDLNPFRKEFKKFPWRRNNKSLLSWQKGQTGYPLVDAGMRQLWRTGVMHNRVRMLVASFLVKHLLIPWQEGARWFWDTLVDADLANNTMGWQWTAGCGADAAPYFRVFNPIIQGEKFDPDGKYVRKWIPELQNVPNKWIHRPWEAPENILSQANVNIGIDYPEPIIDHTEGRNRALEAYENFRDLSNS